MPVRIIRNPRHEVEGELVSTVGGAESGQAHTEQANALVVRNRLQQCGGHSTDGG
jgi:hypothetical protein